jgi:hypothetical protein
MDWKGFAYNRYLMFSLCCAGTRNCDCFNVAIACFSEDSLEFISAVGVEILSWLSGQMTEAHKERIIRKKGTIEKTSVKTLTFSDLMDTYSGRHYIDFLLYPFHSLARSPGCLTTPNGRFIAHSFTSLLP